MKKTATNERYSDVIVSRAVQTDEGATFCLVTCGNRQHWVCLSELVSDEKRIFEELAEVGIPLLTTPARSDLKAKLQNHPVPDTAIVATQPGWIADLVYVHPDGEVQKGDTVDAEIIVAFPPDPAFGTSGKLEAWQNALAPLLKRQHLMSFLLGYGFAALLIAKLQPSPQNPIVELFGSREAGKSTIAMGVGSIFGGDPAGDIGIGRTANATPASFKPVQRMACDSLLFLDETNILDKSVEENLKLFFDHTSRDERLRYGATGRAQPIRNALLLTGNQRLVDRAKAASPITDAARSRCLSIDVGDRVFSGDELTRDEHNRMLNDLRNAANQFYGTACRAFVAKVIAACEKDREAFAKRIGQHMDKFRNDQPEAPDLPNRIVTAIALSYVAGVLAFSWGIWPTEKTSIRRACESIYDEASEMAAMDCCFGAPVVKRLVALIRANSDRIPCIVDGKKPQSSVLANAVGFRVDEGGGVTRVFMKMDELKGMLGASATSELKMLRDLGHVKGEGGKHTRSGSKPPAYVPIDGRVYEITLRTCWLD